MRVRTIGGLLEPKTQLLPAVTEAIEVQGPYPKSVHRVSRDCWVLDYEYTSHGNTRVEAPISRWQERPPLSAHLYPPHTVFFEDTQAERGLRHSSWIHIAGGDKAGLRRLVDKRFGYARFMDPRGEIGEQLRRCALAAHSFGDLAEWQARGLLCLILDSLFSSQPNEAETSTIIERRPAEPQASLADRTREFLKAHVSEKVTLERLARHLRLSVSSVSHRYRDETGESPLATLARLRVEYAKALLLKGMPMKAVAAQLSFCDAFHLSRTFKRVEGVSPKEFLKRQQRQ